MRCFWMGGPAGDAVARYGPVKRLSAGVGLAFLVALALPEPLFAQGAPGSQNGWVNPDCHPEVAEALVTAAEMGVQADYAVIRHTEQGIRKPDSILDLSCVWDMFDYRGFNILHDPGAALDRILNLARSRICSEAREVYHRHIGRSLDAGVFAGPVWRVPGASTRMVYGNALEDAGIERERFRRLFGGSG